jgi:DNA primase
MAYISQQMIDDIRDKADIVEIIQSYIPLKRAGRNFKALCPFHHEKTPSFMVSPDKQIFHCFGCGVGGNIFNFVMKHENLNFKEAVEVVAGKIGFYIPKEKIEQKESSLIKKLFSVNELAANFYHGALLNSPQAEIARRYLKKRAVEEKTIKEFRLGFSFSGWADFVAYAKKKGYSEQLLERVGLAIKGKQGTYYDRFRNKLMFPITNNQGKVLGFGSRTLDEKEEGPKYVNSPETEIYTKRKTLYGLNLAKSHIVKSGIAIITEGYFDVIIPYQAGIQNIVGCLGTSFTPEQAHILKRYAKDVILLFDADKAGESATLRGLDILIEEGLMVKIGCLPPDYDADKLVKQKGKEALNKIIQGSKGLFEYKLDLLKAKYPLKVIENKSKITSEILPTIKKIENSVLKSAYIKRLAQEIEISEQALLDELRKVKQAKYGYETQEEVVSMKLNIPPAERMILRLMLEDVSVINEIKESLEIYDFEHPLIQKIISLLFELGFNEGQLVSSAIMDRIEDEGAQRLISEVLTDTTEIIDRGKSIKDCINSIKKKKLKTKLNQLESQIRYVESVKDEPKRDYLTKEFQRVLKEYSRLSNVR